MSRRYLPDRAVFDRYAPTTRFRLISGYHRKLAGKYRWFVRPYLSEDQPYYVDGDLADVIADADHAVLEIFDCAWVPAEWDRAPWKYNVSERGYTEVYCAERTDPHARGYNVQEIGYKRQPGGQWAFKIYEDRGNSAWINHADDELRIRRDNVIYRWNGEAHIVGLFGQEKPVSSPPADVIIPVLRGMSAKKWRGFYSDDIEYILGVTGVSRTRI